MSKGKTVETKCDKCGKLFQLLVKYRNYDLRNGKSVWYCSVKCANITSISVPCKFCSKVLTRTPSSMKRGAVFCNRSCAAKYNNTHKKHGCKRSKLEIWLEQQLTELYPSLEIHFNRKDAINSELDIYIPSLKLAFELNGIFHYEPIYGADKLDKIQNNDQRKFQACLERGIELCIIDTSKHSYVKESTCRPYLDIIIQVLSVKAELLRSEHTT